MIKKIKKIKNKELLGRFKKDVLLKNYSSFEIGGSAKYFFLAKSKKDLIDAISSAEKNSLPFFILGGGSNLLISDAGYNGLVIKMINKKYKIENEIAYAEAGVPLSFLAAETVKNNLFGLEWAVGIPGTIGGAVYGNAGAFGKSMEDIIKKVEVFDKKTKKIKFLKDKDCKFNYRRSVFKTNKNLIVLSVEMHLKSGNRKSIKEKMKEFLDYRAGHQPLNLPSVGSIFKNPEGFSAGELIEKCGLKGKKIGGAEISRKHANFIINLRNAKAKDVIKLINLIKKRVKNKFNINLEEEIQYLAPKL